jgi:ferric-dicitrate binding protein FerR (iron transport regulator)
MSGSNHDHEAVLARIDELEAANARLAAENDALRTGAPPDRKPERLSNKGMLGIALALALAAGAALAIALERDAHQPNDVDPQETAPSPPRDYRWPKDINKMSDFELMQQYR